MCKKTNPKISNFLTNDKKTNIKLQIKQHEKKCQKQNENVRSIWYIFGNEIYITMSLFL